MVHHRIVRGTAALALLLAATPPAARADLSPFIQELASFGYFIDAAEVCGLRSRAWTLHLLEFITAGIKLTADGDPAHKPTEAQYGDGLVRMYSSGWRARTDIAKNPIIMCAMVKISAGLRDADEMVRFAIESRK